MPGRASGAGRAAGRDAALVLSVMLLLGLLCGLLWSVLATPAEFTKVSNGAAMGEDQLGRQFGVVGWFVLIGGLAGLAAGLVLSWWRSRDPVLTSVLLVVGSLLAAFVMALVGHLLGPGDPRAALRAAQVGAHVSQRLDVGLRPVWPIGPYLRDTATVYLAWPVGALAGALFVLLGRAPDRRPQEAGHESSESASQTHAAG
jgi:hypothetical protein